MTHQTTDLTYIYDCRLWNLILATSTSSLCFLTNCL